MVKSIVSWALASFWSFFGKWLPFRCNPGQTPTSPIVGAYYYPWWDAASDRHWNEGYLRENLSPPQEPLLGQYSSRDATVMEQHLQWANQYQITHFVASWWGRDSFEDVTIRSHLLPSCQDMGCSRLGQVQVALLYESFGILETGDDDKIHFAAGGTNEQILKRDFEYMAATYFGHSNYLKMDGKPVVYLYVSRVYTGSYRQVFDTLRSHIQSSHGYDLYLVGDEVWWDPPNTDRITTFNAITAYNMHGPSQYNGYPDDTGFFADVEATYKTYQSVCGANQVDFIPGVMPAFNDRGVRLSTDHYVIPHERAAYLAGTGHYSTLWESLLMAYRVLRHRPDANRPAIIMITSWNEFHEDTNIEPTKGSARSSREPSVYTQGYTFEDYGFKLLEQIPRFLEQVASGAVDASD